MFDIDVDPQYPDIRKALKGWESEIPLALAQTLTFTAERVATDLTDTMARVFDRPTRFTMNSIYKTSATPKRLFAQVKLKDEAPKGTPAAKYLQPQIEGGARRQKRFERKLYFKGMISANQYLVPGDDARLNSFGNITAGQYTKALSNLGGQTDWSQNTGTTARSTRKQRRSGRQYFWMPGVGVFWRQGKRSLRSFLILASKPNYEKRFDFFGVAEKSVANHLPEQLERSINRVLRKASEARGG